MASWIVHLRLAEKIVPYFNHLTLDKTAFYLGNVAIDSGRVNADQTIDPPVTISHWTPTGVRNQCRYEDFFKTYCKNKQDDFHLSFYLGCVAHLLTDNLWVNEIVFPAKKKYAQQLEKNPDLIYEIKDEWYALDFIYLNQHPHFQPLQQLHHIKNFKNNVLPWFGEEAIQIKLDEIIDFYEKTERFSQMETSYLSEKEMDDFVIQATSILVNELNRLLSKE